MFVNGYGFLSFAKDMGRNISKNISKNLISKYSQKLFDHIEHSATDAFKTASNGAIQKSAEPTDNLIENTSPKSDLGTYLLN